MTAEFASCLTARSKGEIVVTGCPAEATSGVKFGVASSNGRNESGEPIASRVAERIPLPCLAQTLRVLRPHVLGLRACRPRDMIVTARQHRVVLAMCARDRGRVDRLLNGAGAGCRVRASNAHTKAKDTENETDLRVVI